MKYTPILSYPHIPFLCLFGPNDFGIIPWQVKHRLNDLWSLFPGRYPTLQKGLCFLGMFWIAPLFFSREAACVFTLCLPNHTPNKLKQRGAIKSSHLNCFWTIFWQEMFQVRGYFSYKKGRHHLPDKSFCHLTLMLAAASCIIVMSQIPADSDQGHLDLWELINRGPGEVYASRELFHWSTRTRFKISWIKGRCLIF